MPKWAERTPDGIFLWPVYVSSVQPHTFRGGASCEDPYLVSVAIVYFFLDIELGTVCNNHESSDCFEIL